jgi:hypothetical protein
MLAPSKGIGPCVVLFGGYEALFAKAVGEVVPLLTDHDRVTFNKDGEITLFALVERRNTFSKLL